MGEMLYQSSQSTACSDISPAVAYITMITIIIRQVIHSSRHTPLHRLLIGDDDDGRLCTFLRSIISDQATSQSVSLSTWPV